MFLNKRKAIFLISVFSLIFILTINQVKSQEIKIITGSAIVTDGDSIKINNNRIRLVGIDAPEINQKCIAKEYGGEYPCGKWSKSALENFVEESYVTCF